MHKLTLLLLVAIATAAFAPAANAAPAKHHAHAVKKKKKKVVKRGPRGPRGYTGFGADGAQGPAGPAGGFTNAAMQTVTGPVTAVYSPVPGGESIAQCPAGKRALSGGWDLDVVFLAVVRWSRPTPDGTGWSVYAQSDYADGAFHAVAICA